MRRNTESSKMVPDSFLHSTRKTLFLRFVFLFCAIAAVFGGAEAAGFGGRIGLGGEDYRVAVDWLPDSTPKGPDRMRKPGDYGRKLTVDGRERFYKIHVPASVDASKPAPVVMIFHGGGGYPGAVRHQSGMDAVSEREGFLAVYPAGTGRLFDDRLLVWNDGREPKDGSTKGVDDVAFVKALLEDLTRYFMVDSKRIYATGISNGALMCYRLAQQLSERIAAIGPVSGQRAVDEFFPKPKRAVPIIHFHGKADSYAPFEGGTPKRSNFKSGFKPVVQALETWVAHNGCPTKPAQTKRVGNAVKTTYRPCRNGADVVLWTLEDGGHSWPGGKMSPAEVKAKMGNINKDIAASEVMWDFFKEHALP